MNVDIKSEPFEVCSRSMPYKIDDDDVPSDEPFIFNRYDTVMGQIGERRLSVGNRVLPDKLSILHFKF